MGIEIVPFDERHTGGVLALIGGVYGEYGLTFDPADYDGDLTRINAAYRDSGGAFWVLEDSSDGRVLGSVAVVALSPRAVEIKRVYLNAALRGRGLGKRLVEHATAWARVHGHDHITLWSDVKFTRSHAIYERLGFVRTGVRECDDIDKSREYHFEKTLVPEGAAAR